LAQRLLERMQPLDLAVALVQKHRTAMPQPEELIDLSPAAGGDRTKAHHRPGFEDVVWFRMDIGRRHRADPRWLMPLLCRRGHITRNEIGAIRIAANETFFQVPRAIEARFRAALQRTAQDEAEDESGIRIEPAPDSPREAARSTAREHRPMRNGPTRSGPTRSDAAEKARGKTGDTLRPVSRGDRDGQRSGPGAGPRSGPRSGPKGKHHAGPRPHRKGPPRHRD